MLMIIWLCLRWWYGAGWLWAWQTFLVERAEWVSESFSAPELIKTLFAPFRQTFVGQTRGSIGDKFRGMIDKFISRVIGFIVRVFLLFVASIMLLVVVIAAIIGLVAWPFIPLLPIIGVYCALTGFGI